MPDINEDRNDEKKEINETDKEQKEKINEFLNQIQQEDRLNDEELKAVRDMIENIINKKKNIKKSHRFFKAIKSFFIKTLILYVLGLVAFGLLFSFVALNNKYEIFIIAIIIGAILSIYEILPSLFRKSDPKAFIILFIAIVVNFCLLNNVYTVFDSWFWCVIYLLAVEILYALIMFYRIRKKYRF